MTIAELEQIFTDQQAFRQLTESIRPGSTVQLASLVGSSLSLVAHGAIARLGGVHVLVAEDRDAAGYLYNDLYPLTGGEGLFFFPTGYKRSIQYGQEDPSGLVQRTTALNALRSAADKPLIVCAYPEARTEKVADGERLSDSVLKLRRGDNLSTAFVEEALRECRFERVEFVYEPGQYSVRGGIVDIFSYSDNKPYRIDFFGDEIDSIRPFDVGTQLSTGTLDEVEIVPNLKTVTSVEHRVSLARFAGEVTYWIADGDYTLKRFDDIRTKILGDLDEPSSIDTLVTSRKGFLSDAKKAAFVLLRDNVRERPAEVRVAFDTTPQPEFNKKFDLLADDINANRLRGYSTCLLSDNKAQIERLSNIFNSIGEKNVVFDSVPLALHAGFVDHTSKNCFYTDHQIFDRFHKYTLKSEHARSGKLALSLKELNQIEVGDYIVHVDHGIGRFGGLIHTEINGKIQEVIKLTYQNDDIIFVSIHALHKLAKYRAKEGEAPRINKLGSGAWERMKEKTKGKMKEIARDLIKLYAARKEEKGFAFSPDSFLQQELEASFIYEDTPDQIKSTAEVKADMERERPMDRLICGDVGFGKTEIAIRAAFKATCDNKQVAVLVPTTVLAFQHYQTFKERLKEFPVRIEYLSRARKASEVKSILKDLADRKIDIIIGTHKLIGKDVKFNDLGLLIVDEEQKFGVAVKEKLKQMKVNVDTLTMSATPIPRTLQFSLMGARDLSVISTPPANRYPIQTEIHAFNDDIIKEAINFEMSRGGQIFFVNNRIPQLYELENTIHRLVPDARVVIGHGQMPPEKLEQAIIDFVNYDYDILLATTIIESGIDMPNTNTIIINDAQNFGLSELHQLRGRVGRSNRKAFCYLLTPPRHTFSVDARRRLQAIESFSELGSGIHIAMQDLDIRGAGNLLGAEQSGFIADLGYETYQKILKEAVEELKNDEFSDLYYGADSDTKPEEFVSECTIESDLEILFPANYVPQESERISLYQELDNMERETDIRQFCERLEDRFGRIPHEAMELIRVVRLRRLAKQLGIEKVGLKQGYMYLYFVSDEHVAYYQSAAFGRILGFLQKNPKLCKLREINGRRSLAIKDITSVESAVSVLEEVLQTPPV